MEENVEYPLKKGDSKWTDEYRKQWNREYRKKIKEGKIQPTKRKDVPSKWDDKNYRRAFDNARKTKIAEEKKLKKMSQTDPNQPRPNFTNQEKEQILKKMLEDVKDGKNPTHPFFELGLISINKRIYPKREN